MSIKLNDKVRVFWQGDCIWIGWVYGILHLTGKETRYGISETNHKDPFKIDFLDLRWASKGQVKPFEEKKRRGQNGKK